MVSAKKASRYGRLNYWGDIMSHGKRRLFYHSQSWKKARAAYLAYRKAIVAIDDYLKSRTDSNKALFVSKDKPYNRLQNSAIEIITRNYGKACGIENCHPHLFRRTGATFALKRGMPIEQVSTILGHESIETTQIYLDISEDDVAMAHRKYAG